MKIDFNRPYVVGKEFEYIQTAIKAAHLSGNGQFTKKCQGWFEEKLGARKALLTHSCTAALEMAAILTDIGLGDEVIMPSFTFVSTANAFVLRGANSLRYYMRALGRLGGVVRRGADLNDGKDFSATQASVFLEGFTFRRFVEDCHAENLRRMSGFDPELLQPRFLPALASTALSAFRLARPAKPNTAPSGAPAATPREDSAH